MADVLSGDSVAIHTTVRISRAVFVLSGVIAVDKPRVEKKILISLDVVTGVIEVTHDDLSYSELIGLLETAKMIVFRDFVSEPEG